MNTYMTSAEYMKSYEIIDDTYIELTHIVHMFIFVFIFCFIFWGPGPGSGPKLATGQGPGQVRANRHFEALTPVMDPTI